MITRNPNKKQMYLFSQNIQDKVIAGVEISVNTPYLCFLCIDKYMVETKSIPAVATA